MKIVVIGATGLVGTRLVPALQRRGHDVVPASPATGVDTITGAGLATALAGAEVVVDVSNASSHDVTGALSYFETSTLNLLAAEAIAGVGHHVGLSVIGTDRLANTGYFGAKVIQERLVQASPIPWSIVHATQLFELAHRIADTATVGKTIRLAPVLVQPVAAEDLASVLADIAGGTPTWQTVEIAGPQQFRLDEFVRRALADDGDARTVIADREAQFFGAALCERTFVPEEISVLTVTRYDEWARARRTAYRDTRCIADALIFEHAQVSGEPFQIDPSTWAIHGLIPVDGDVILAKFVNRAEAQAAITQLRDAERSSTPSSVLNPREQS